MTVIVLLDMVDDSQHYTSPEVVEYGSVESITQDDKYGDGEDQYSEQTPLTGSVYPD